MEGNLKWTPINGYGEGAKQVNKPTSSQTTSPKKGIHRERRRIFQDEDDDDCEDCEGYDSCEGCDGHAISDSTESKGYLPTAFQRKFHDAYYERYDHKQPNNPRKVSHNSRCDLDDTYGYKLFVKGRFPSFGPIPQVGVRLDDLTVARLLREGHPDLNRNWFFEFDKSGMVRSIRVPLGRAYKVYVNVGETDMDGTEIEDGEEGWYYGWWRGIHLLCGKEGFDLYKRRSGSEDAKCEGFEFKKGFRAVHQFANGKEPFPGDNDHLPDGNIKEG